jgi:tetratricopeptide (TPR) repeat protein
MARHAITGCVKRLVVLVGVFAIACKSEPAAPDVCGKATVEGPLAWIADDYGSALACARQKKVPVVVDIWAPWCHTCLSMQSTVFVDPSFAKDKDRFVFVKLDGDKEINARALGKLSISAWPTFYVVGQDETVLARWVGAASVGQFHDFLDAGARATAGGQAASDAHLLSAQRALAAKDSASADTELAAALAAAPETWPRRAEALGSLIMTKWKRSDLPGCLDVAEKHMDETGNTAAASDFLVTAMSCAEASEKDAPDRVKALREKAVARWKQLLAESASPMSVDDRSDAMASTREALEALGNKDEAHIVAEKQRAMLDDAAAKAATPFAAMTYNWPRAEVYVYLGRALDLVPALEKSAKDLPEEYDPRARLGWLYLKAGKLDDAARWTDQALSLVYGPRKARIVTQRADIAKAAGDTAAERTYREQVVKLWESLPPEQQSADNLAKAKAALTACNAPH